ncbi:MAG TPA: hypothetical protein DCZ91_11830 [Lachnospiraceae bacterium]|nr:hypothetical protein [Lachnospiraceae bacterium]
MDCLEQTGGSPVWSSQVIGSEADFDAGYDGVNELGSGWVQMMYIKNPEDAGLIQVRSDFPGHGNLVLSTSLCSVLPAVFPGGSAHIFLE